MQTKLIYGDSFDPLRQQSLGLNRTPMLCQGRSFQQILAFFTLSGEG